MVMVYSPIKTRQRLYRLHFVVNILKASLVTYVLNVITLSGKSLGKYIILIYFYLPLPCMVNARQ